MFWKKTRKRTLELSLKLWETVTGSLAGKAKASSASAAES
jgi:hypothetical protein